MEKLHEYVPVKSVTNEVSDEEDYLYHNLLLGGDQLTIALSRSSIAICADHDLAREHLEGSPPVVEDWHTKMTLVKVSNIINYVTVVLFAYN